MCISCLFSIFCGQFEGHNRLCCQHWFLLVKYKSVWYYLRDVYMRRQSNHHWFWEWLVAWSAPSLCLNQCWNIINWTLGNKLQWNYNRNFHIFIHENAFENVFWLMSFYLGVNVLSPVFSCLSLYNPTIKSKIMQFQGLLCLIKCHRNFNFVASSLTP